MRELGKSKDTAYCVLQVDGCRRMNHTKGLSMVDLIIYHMTFQMGNTSA